MKYALVCSLGLAVVATAAPVTARDAIRVAIKQHEPKSWFTLEQKVFIQAKCGGDVDSQQRNVDINGATMTCPDGRIVNDPQVRAISEDITRRVNDYTRDIMKQADVQRTVAIATRENVRSAIDEAHIDQQVQHALAQAEVTRKAAERGREALVKSGISDTH